MLRSASYNLLNAGLILPILCRQHFSIILTRWHHRGTAPLSVSPSHLGVPESCVYTIALPTASNKTAGPSSAVRWPEVGVLEDICILSPLAPCPKAEELILGS